MPDPTYGGPGRAGSPSWVGRGRRAGEGAKAQAQASRRGPARRGEEASAVVPDGGVIHGGPDWGEEQVPTSRAAWAFPRPQRCTGRLHLRRQQPSSIRERAQKAPPSCPAPSSRHARTHVHAMRSAAGSPRVGGTPCGRGPLAARSICSPLRAFDLRPPSPILTRSTSRDLHLGTRASLQGRTVRHRGKGPLAKAHRQKGATPRFERWPTVASPPSDYLGAFPSKDTDHVC